MRNAAGLPQGKATFKPVRLGAGGFVTGLSISTDGVTQACRIDVFGGYVKSTGDKVWRQAFDFSTMATGDCPGTAGYVGPSGSLTDGNGCYEMVVAPNNNAILYSVFNARLFKSTNTGHSWTHLTGVPDFLSLANSGPQPHNSGPNIAVDPQNASVFLMGTPANGLYYSTNGGTTITNVAFATNGSISTYQMPSKVACDPTSTVTGGVKQRWVAAKQGTGVYVSTTGPGGTYTATTGGPTFVGDMVFDVSGNLWAVDPSNTAGTVSNLWKMAAGGTTWVQGPGSPPPTLFGVTIACDPLTSGASGRIVVLSDQAHAMISSNGGTSWLGSSGSGYIYNGNYPSTPTIICYPYTISWLGSAPNWEEFNPGMARFDPVTSNRLWCSTGTDVRYCPAPTAYDTTAASRFVWIEATEGIENLVATTVVELAGGPPLFGVWDRGVWRVPNLDQSPHSPNLDYSGAFTNGVQAAWDIAIAADNPNWVAAIISFNGQVSGYSTDGWQTVNAFPTAPPFSSSGGCLAVGNAGNVIMIPSSNGQPQYTKNGGSTWATLPFPGLPASGSETGFGFANYNLTKYITYDAGAGAFYLYNYGPAAAPTLAGVYKSVNQGDTWTKVFSGNVVSGSDSYRAKLRAVPGHTGHLFFADGAATGGNALKRSTDGGVTWTAISTVTTVYDYAFGASAPGQTYPSIYFYGTVGGVAGLYRSDDNFATTPRFLVTFPYNIVDGVQCVGASPNKYGRVYVGFSGSGFVYGDYDSPITLS